jgi:hypothetical protein
MQYQTKKMKITAFLKKIINGLEQAKKDTAEKSLLVASASLELGIAEKDIEEVLETFERAKILKINDNKVVLY